MYTRTIGDTAIEEVKSENGKPRVSEQKPSLLELLTRAGAGSSARSVVKGESQGSIMLAWLKLSCETSDLRK